MFSVKDFGDDELVCLTDLFCFKVSNLLHVDLRDTRYTDDGLVYFGKGLKVHKKFVRVLLSSQLKGGLVVVFLCCRELSKRGEENNERVSLSL